MSKQPSGLNVVAAPDPQDSPPTPMVNITAILPSTKNSLQVLSKIPINGHASQYLPVTIKPRRTKRVDILSPLIKKVDFLCIQIGPRTVPPGDLNCRFGIEDSEDREEEQEHREDERHKDKRDETKKEESFEEGIEKDEKRVGSYNEKEEKRYGEHNEKEEKRYGEHKDQHPYIKLDEDLVIIGRPLIRLLGNINTITFYNNHDEDADVTIYVAYEV